MKRQLYLLGTVAALGICAPQVWAQEAQVEADVDLPKASTRTEVTRDRDVDIRADVERTDRERIRQSDKASGLIGMEVRNNNNEKLGDVKDLVIDMNSGRLSYAVLAVGGFLGIGEKLIALPPGALKVSEDGQHLLLDADKSRIQAAPGFAATAWPAPGDPEVNRFWTDLRGTGAPARGEISGDRDLEVKGDVDLDKDRKGRIYTDAEKDKKIKIEAEKD